MVCVWEKIGTVEEKKISYNWFVWGGNWYREGGKSVITDVLMRAVVIG